MIHKVIRYCALAGAVGLGACDLAVQNPNAPETARVLASPADVETLLGNYYKRMHDGLYRTTGSLWGMMNVMSFENYSSLANDGQNARSGIPRPPNDNSIGNPTQSNQSRTFFIHSEVLRVATNIVKQLNTPGFNLGGSPARDLKAKAFAEFLRGVSMGYLAMIYDSAAVVHEGMGGAEAGDYIGYLNVRDSAMAAFARSIAYAGQANAVTGQTDGFPVTWISSTTSMTYDNFVRLVRSYRARIAVGVARNLAERGDISTAAGEVDWNFVIADAQAGNLADFYEVTNPTTGPFKTWVNNYHSLGNWHQMTPFIIGMGDTTSGYANWISQPLDSRGAGAVFFMNTPDQRWPQGATRALQQADHVIQNCEVAATVCKRYFRNRPSTDDNTSGSAWGVSQYDNLRFWSWYKKGDANSAQAGAILFMPKSELRLIEAEGHLRKPAGSGGPDYVSAANLINVSRTAPMVGGVATGGGLPAVLPVAGGGLVMPDCVPRRPVNAGTGGGGTVQCGDLMEALKWEKRMETHFVHFGAWFFDNRGWDDLPQGTPLHWAPPYQDLLSRNKPIYSVGTGASGGFAAGASTYGW